MDDDLLPAADRRSIDPTGPQFASLGDLDSDQPLVMLNLLRFREVADYSAHPDLAADEAISGSEAYQRYGDAAQPHISAAGASIEYLARCAPSVIGPADERWDMVILVRYPNPGAFVTMVTDPDYQALSGHRTAALADSRLIPTIA
jgi:uncharacterized protein (DUF1330 family)